MYTGYWSHYGHQPSNCHHFYPALLVAREIDADTATPTRDGLVGGARPVFLSLEYLVDAGRFAHGEGDHRGRRFQRHLERRHAGRGLHRAPGGAERRAGDEGDPGGEQCHRAPQMVRARLLLRISPR